MVAWAFGSLWAWAILIGLLSFLPLKAAGAGASNIELDHIDVDATNKASLQSGAKTLHELLHGLPFNEVRSL